MYTTLPVLLLQLFLLLPIAWGDYLAINWSDVGALANRPASANDAAVTPLEPCPCDLTLTACDLNCCCDEHCSRVERTTFICLEGLQGGQETVKHPEHMCQYWRPYSSEWHDLLCIVIENTPYLGHFYKHEPPVMDFSEYLSRVKQPSHSYKYKNDHVLDKSFHQHYILGSPLETLLINDSDVRGVLSLPQQLLNGVCIRTVPVHFLDDFENMCPIPVSPSVCDSDPLLSVDTYLTDSEGYNIGVIGNLTGLETVNISVIYECLNYDTLKYLKIQEGMDIDTMEFGRRENRYDKECQEINLPYYNASSQTCENVVLSVEYSFVWSGPIIYDVQARIKLGNIPMTTEVPEPGLKYLLNVIPTNEDLKFQHSNRISSAPKVSLIQHFAVSFFHMGATDPHETVCMNISTIDRNLTTEGNYSSVEDEYMLDLSERSGNPGYILNRPLLTGYAVYNMTAPDNRSSDSEELLYVEVNRTTGLYVWRPDASGECSLAELDRVVFGYDVISSCLYHWISTSVNCHQLREKLKTVFSFLVQGDVTSKLGWPNVTQENDFLPIIMDNGGTDSRSNSEIVIKKAEKSVTNDPTTVSDDETTFSSDGVDDDDNTVSSESGRCFVPHALEYQVIYQDITQPSSKPTHQLVGILVKLHHRIIQLSTNASQGWIPLTTSAIFSNKQRQSVLSRFWESMEDRWCSGGTCWRELLYPWTHSEAGEGSLPTLTAITAHISTLTANTILLAGLALPVSVVACCCW